MNEILKELAEDIKKDLIFYIENDFKEKLKKEMLKELKDEFKENSLNKEIIESELSEGSEQSEDYYNYVTNSDIENVKNNVTIEQNKVSILLPVYNNKQDILKAIKSVELQTYKDWELIIIDDYSTDNTYEILKEYVEKSDFKDKIILKRNEKNIGCYSSLNEGLLLSKGEFITRLDSDDIYKRRKLEKQVNFLKDNKNSKACITLFTRDNNPPDNGDVTIMIRHEIIKDIGYFDNVRFGADSEFYWRIYKYYGSSSIGKINETLYIAKKRQNSLTTSKDSGNKQIRLDYIEKYHFWQESALEKGKLFIKYPSDKRPFKVKKKML